MSETDRIFNWRPSFDARSLDFPIRGMVPADVRRNKLWKVGPILDQGREGACVGFGWTAEALSTPTAVHLDRMAANVPHDPTAFAQNLYHVAKTLDDMPGENYDGTSVLAGAKAMTQFGLLKEYRWATSIDDVVNAIIHRGPVVLGIEWHKEMYDAPGGVLTLGGPVVGGHCITAVGYRTAASSRIPGEETIVLQNSWGIDWGINGLAEIRVSDVKKLLDAQGEACVPYKRSFGR